VFVVPCCFRLSEYTSTLIRLFSRRSDKLYAFASPRTKPRSTCGPTNS